MPMSVRANLDEQVKSGLITEKKANAIHTAYLDLKEKYLAGTLDKTAMALVTKTRMELERLDQRESNNLPKLEDTVLLIIATGMSRMVQ